MADTVLVTGGTGFIARWCIAQLLEQGYAVRTTLRSRVKADVVRAAVGEVAAIEQLSFTEADLTSDAGWAEAVSGCRYVLHPASPLGSGRESADELIESARGGALRVLRAAAAEPSVQRVVLTSAANASSPTSYRTPGTTDETLWTDPDAGLDPYRRSKTLAEKAAWDFAASCGDALSLTTVLPGAVLGPILGADNLGSVQVVGRLLRGEMPRVPNIGLEVVDVRDVADLHVRAMTSPVADGQRYLGTGDLLWMPGMAKLLRDELGAAAAKVPTKAVPDALLKVMARRRPELAGVLPGLGRRNVHTTAKAEQQLGWKRRPGTEAVLDCARSLLAHGVA